MIHRVSETPNVCDLLISATLPCSDRPVRSGKAERAGRGTDTIVDSLKRRIHLPAGQDERRRECQGVSHGNLEGQALVETAVKNLLGEVVSGLLAVPGS